jgi:esterase FrsA
MSECVELSVAPGIDLYHAGPALDHGPLPSLFYFALSGPDSLSLDPFNQPVQFLRGKMIRVFSLTLPAHENKLPPTAAMQTWAEDYARGADPLGEFLDNCAAAVAFAIEQKFADPKKLAAAGLSRGGLAALHAAARDERFRSVLAFAPITKLSALKEFHSLKTQAQVFDAENVADSLCDRSVRLYIGNCDTRVDTRSCFEFASALAQKAIQRKIRSPQIEFIMTPSIGMHGHGTSPEIFKQGADWIASQLSAQ